MVASHDATAASHHDVDLRVEGERERHRRELASSREFSAVTPNGGGGETCV